MLRLLILVVLASSAARLSAVSIVNRCTSQRAASVCAFLRPCTCCPCCSLRQSVAFDGRSYTWPENASGQSTVQCAGQAR
jgi:hypothetical protein